MSNYKKWRTQIWQGIKKPSVETPGLNLYEK